MKGSSTFKVVISALFAALICVATMIVQIPIPATGGYANLGDGVILICAFLMHPAYAVCAAGVGSLLADVLAGYAAYAPGTLVIKACVAFVAAMVFNRFGNGSSGKKQLAVMAAAGIAAEGVMVPGYFLYESVILGMGMAAAGGIIGNVAQGCVAVLAACLIAPVLNGSDEIRELMDKTHR